MAGQALKAGVAGSEGGDLRQRRSIDSVGRLRGVIGGNPRWNDASFRDRSVRTIYPGRASVEHRFRIDNGLEELRELASRLSGTGEGVVLVGNAGVTSHLGDVLRRAKIPSRIEPEV
jgi:hypothetical protein